MNTEYRIRCDGRRTLDYLFHEGESVMFLPFRAQNHALWLSH